MPHSGGSRYGLAEFDDDAGPADYSENASRNDLRAGFCGMAVRTDRFVPPIRTILSAVRPVLRIVRILPRRTRFRLFRP